ncbi:hypothetical protein GCM10023319_73140 [Nocardia iowensis]
MEHAADSPPLGSTLPRVESIHADHSYLPLLKCNPLNGPLIDGMVGRVVVDSLPLATAPNPAVGRLADSADRPLRACGPGSIETLTARNEAAQATAVPLHGSR